MSKCHIVGNHMPGLKFCCFRAQRILQLEKRIKQHTAHMHERRKMPKGTPQEEMEAARKELEVVNIFIIQLFLDFVNP